MNFQEYSKRASATDINPDKSPNYYFYGLAGEVGEITEKLKKYMRDHGLSSPDQMTPEQWREVLYEVGDCLWYLDAIARLGNSSLEEVANMNLEKLEDRLNRGVIKGNGDHR